MTEYLNEVSVVCATILKIDVIKNLSAKERELLPALYPKFDDTSKHVIEHALARNPATAGSGNDNSSSSCESSEEEEESSMRLPAGAGCSDDED